MTGVRFAGRIDGGRSLWPAAVVSILLLLWCGICSAKMDVHREATAALTDTRAAIAEIERAADLTTSGPDRYRAAARRAINALVGVHDDAYSSQAGNPGDAQGALGHLQTLLHRRETRPWSPAVHGAWVHTIVAVSELRDALKADGLDEFAGGMTDALQSLEMVLGRRSQGDSIGALEGALATTELGVPAGANRISGCSTPESAPAYGLRDGQLLFVALPLKEGRASIPSTLVADAVHVKDGFVVIDTPVHNRTRELCAETARTGDAAAEPDPPAADRSVDDGGHGKHRGDPPPKLFTRKQALHGRRIFARTCATCHGADMQGGSAPPNGGRVFLNKAEKLDWSVSDLQYLVTNTMPLNNPGSLTPEQYAAVIAYLLAADCYPAGDRPFPTSSTSLLQHTELEPVKGVKPDNPDIGTCNP